MPVGILDWYTVLAGVYALFALVMHGGAFLCWKSEGILLDRCRIVALRAGLLVTAMWPGMTYLTVRVNPAMFHHFAERPLAWVCIGIALAGQATLLFSLVRGRYRNAFAGSSAFLLGLLAATAVSVFPVMLRSAGDPSLSIDAYRASNTPDALRTALHWWLVGIPLVIVYFVIQFRVHAGKVPAPREGEGY
jgi:cytochrome d ubiquinol oxidase subunit II